MATTTPPAPPARRPEEPDGPDASGPRPVVAHKGLKVGAIGLISSIVIGVASTAPGYSLASALGYIASDAQEQTPVVILLAFVPMLFISYAYKALNNADPDCGTSFTWVARALGRRTGWLTGWVIVAADVIVMANLAQIAGRYTFSLLGLHGFADSTGWQTVVGCVWIALMTWIAYVGIELSARTQVLLLSLELLVLVLFAVVCLAKVYDGTAGPDTIHPSLSWFNPFAGSLTFASFSAAFLSAVFIYWGWDSAVAANEETTDRHVTPGRAAVWSTVILLLTYVLVGVAAVAFAGVGDTGLGLSNPDNIDDVFAGIGDAALGTWGVKLLVLAVLSSAAASTQTTILPTARTTLAMAAYKALPKAFGTVHPRHLTPTVSTWAMGLVSIAFYAALTVFQPKALGDLILSIGLLIAFYYGLTGFASAVYFHREIRRSPRAFLFKGLFPVLGGLILFAAFVKTAADTWATDYGETSYEGVGGVFVLGVGSILLGVVFMVIWNVLRPAYFRGTTMHSGLSLSETGEEVRSDAV